MDDIKDILFASVNLPSIDKISAVEQLMKIDSTFWFWDPYRATRMLPLMTKGGVGGAEGAINYRSGEFVWLDYTPIVIQEWFETIVFPWMGQKTRIMALMTKPEFKNNEHIDCSLTEIGTKQHKFRIVLKGNTDTLYFKTDNGDVRPPNTSLPFIMDGGWPHGMYNNTDEIKITLAAGAPWNGNEKYTDIDVHLKRSNFSLPLDLSRFSKFK